jgi:methionyl aminopeptidase
MIHLKSPKEIERMKTPAQIDAEVLAIVRENCKDGVTTWDLDRIAEEETVKRGGRPTFKGYRGFPASLCVSVNDEVVHGIPSAARVLAEGDVVGLDFGAVLDGWYGDAARTVPVGAVGAEAARLLAAGDEALARGIRAARAGGTTGDIGAAVQEYVEAQGYSIVRDFVGHGIGRRLHEPPHLPNYGQRGRGEPLRPGMVLAIEPMVNAGRPEVEQLDDGWTAVTADGSLSVHFEDTVAITENGPEILTLRTGGR